MAQAYSFQFLNLEREESVRVECAAVHTHDTSTEPRHRDHTLCTFKCFSISNPTHNTPWSASFKGSVVRGWFESAVLEYWNHNNRQCFGLFGYKFENHKSYKKKGLVSLTTRERKEKKEHFCRLSVKLEVVSLGSWKHSLEKSVLSGTDDLFISYCKLTDQNTCTFMQLSDQPIVRQQHKA